MKSKPDSEIRIVKIATCPSASGKSTLTYHVGAAEDGVIQCRVYANSAPGMFSREWLPLASIESALAKGGSHYTSRVLQPLFRGKSQNNSAFLLAVLLSVGLVQRAADKPRYYQTGDGTGFKAEIQAMVESKVSLTENQKPVKSAVQQEPKLVKPASGKAPAVQSIRHIKASDG